jgi:hypothetical protein
MASTSLTRTPSSATNRKTFTISMWVKRAELSTQQCLFSVGNGSSNPLNFFGFYLDKFVYWEYSNSTTGLSDLQSNLVLRDVNSWYHLVASVDTTQATASDRIKLYVNGTQVTSFSSSSYPSQNQDLGFNNTQPHDIGRYLYTGTAYYGGEMAHFHFIDGTAYAPTDFGETDSTSGVWKPKTQPSVTYGTNGFFLDFANSSDLGNDVSGNNNDFTLSGSGTQTLDTPSNVYATLNPLLNYPSGMTFSNGNTTLTCSTTQWQGSASTLAPTKGKWYFEAKYNTGTGIHLDIGRADADWINMATVNNSYLSYRSLGYGYQLNNTGYDYYCNNTCTNWTTNRGNSTKTLMVAVDLDNGKIWFGDSGTWYNTSGTADPATGTDPRFSFSADLNGEAWFFGMSIEGTASSHNLNFGNGYFGTTAISSPNSDGAGEGKFAYAPPTGYYALNTKNLKTYG